MCKNTIDFRRGDKFQNLVLLGACPGQDEFDAVPQRPFAGQSGRNLKILLEVLRDLPDKKAFGLGPDDFATDNLDDYTLMNSHAEARWHKEHGRTTPRMREVESPENHRRIVDQLTAVRATVVIGLGRPIADVDLTRIKKDSGPMRVIRNLAGTCRGISFFVTGHPSPQAINRYAGGDARRWFQEKLRRFPV